MVIEIKGVGFINKGAELMLLAILKIINENFNNVKFVMSPGKTSSFYNRAKLGLYQKLWYKRYKIQWGYFAHIIPASFRRTYGLIADKEIEIVLDASGFSYGDQLGPTTTLSMARYIKNWKKQKTKVILLPQAFGPFTGKKIKRAMNIIINNADLIFPRDQISLEYLKDINNNTNNIYCAPDFTIDLKAEYPDYIDECKNKYCIVPNFRVVDMLPPNNYIDVLKQCVKKIVCRNQDVFFLIQEKNDDFGIATQINKELKLNLPIICEDNALYIKGILKESKALISSRYHSIICALSQGVPVLYRGWSHKYKVLMKEYGCEEYHLDFYDISKNENILNKFLSENNLKSLRKSLIQISYKHKEKVKRMWKQVVDTIKHEI